MGGNKQVYAVMVLRRDSDHITAIETEQFDNAYQLWTDLKAKWYDSIKEQKPFELEKPIVTAFDPGLISEIKILAYMVQESVASNPYTQEMQKKGLTSALNQFRSAVPTDDLLDSGYKLD
jgi:hypothetical protein